MKHDMGELIFFYMRVGEQSILCKREWADSHIWKNSILRIVHAWMGEVVLKQRNLKKKEKVKWQMAKSKKGEFAIDYWESSLKQESKWFLVIRDNSGSVGRYFFFFCNWWVFQNTKTMKWCESIQLKEAKKKIWWFSDKSGWLNSIPKTACYLVDIYS